MDLLTRDLELQRENNVIDGITRASDPLHCDFQPHTISVFALANFKIKLRTLRKKGRGLTKDTKERQTCSGIKKL